ncbi:MAG: LIC11966 family surface protein [Bacteroidales bacterium]
MHTKFTIIIISAFLLFACTNISENAIKYNDQIINLQHKIVRLFNKLDSSFADTINHSFKIIHQELLQEIESQLKSIDSIPNFDNKDRFKQEYKTLLTVYYDVVKNDYSKMINLYLLPDSLYTQNVKDDFLQTNKIANEKLQHALNKFIEAQKQFAIEYKFNLQDENE